MSRIGETLAPRRLGTSFRWLWASSWASQLGDGFAIAAAPLLVASQTHDPFLVAMGATLQHLPVMLFGLFAGVVADRVDRRLVVVAADACRALILVVLTLTIVTEQVHIAVVLVAIFLLGTAETFADSAYMTLMPMVVVDKADYGIANSRLQSGTLIANQMGGPPLGAALFATGMAVPFVAQAVLLIASASLLFKMKIPVLERTHDPQHVIADIRDGLVWLWHHAAVRTLTLTIVSFNVTFGAAWSVLVLYATQRLDLGEVGFGLLTSAMAAGGILGIASYGWLEKRVSLGNIMRAGLILETLTHLALAVTTVPWVALSIMFVFGAHAFIWGTTSSSVRQRAVPTELQGRVGSVYLIGVFGGIVLGGAVGGLVARQWGVTGPFWFAFVGSGVILAVIWPQLRHIAHEDEIIRAETGVSDA